MQIRMNCSKVRDWTHHFFVLWHETHSSLLAKIKQKPFSISIIFFANLILDKILFQQHNLGLEYNTQDIITLPCWEVSLDKTMTAVMTGLSSR